MHYVCDTALREDACRVRKGSLPRVMAAFANLDISVLRLLGKQNPARAMDIFRLRPNTAVAAVWSAAACAAALEALLEPGCLGARGSPSCS